MKKLKKIKLKSIKQKHSKKITRCNKKSQKVFLLKLFNVLNDKEKGFSKYIYWSTKGNSFIIPDKDEFAENVLPNICKTKIYTSFVRNLNLYGFRKTENKPIEYEHEEPPGRMPGGFDSFRFSVFHMPRSQSFFRRYLTTLSTECPSHQEQYLSRKASTGP